MKYILFLAIATSCGGGYPALAQANSNDDVIQFINAEIKLTEKRIQILKLNRSQGKYDRESQINDRVHSDEKYAADYEALSQKLRALNTIQVEYRAKLIDGNQALSRLSNKSFCELTGCLKILGVVNQNLAKSIGDITKKIVIQDWDKFATQEDDRLNSAEKAYSLNEFSKLQMRNWACERGLMQASTPVSLQPVKLGVCFASVISEVASELKTTPKVSNGSSLKSPGDQYLAPWSEKHERVQRRIAESADYQLKPWDLLRTCAKEESASLREALHLCYEVLRYNRSRPDMARKLLDIRGDRGQGGDNSGDWYHFFAMAEMSTFLGNYTEALYSMVPWDKPLEFLGQKPDRIEKRNDVIGINTGIAAATTLRNFSGSRAIRPSTEACQLNDLWKVSKESKEKSK